MVYDMTNPDAVGRLVGSLSRYLNKKGFEDEIGLYGKIGVGQSAKVTLSFFRYIQDFEWQRRSTLQSNASANN